MSCKRPSWLAIGAVFAWSLVVSCRQHSATPAAPPDTRAQDQAAIRAADADWIKAAETKDLDRCVAPYLDDAVVFSPGAPALVGKENIRRFFERMLAVPNTHFVFSDAVVDVARSGDLAEDRGSFQVTTTDKAGKPSTQTGEYVLVWKKQGDGLWKIAADTSANDK